MSTNPHFFIQDHLSFIFINKERENKNTKLWCFGDLKGHSLLLAKS